MNISPHSSTDEYGTAVMDAFDDLIRKGFSRDQATEKLGPHLDKLIKRRNSEEFVKRMGNNPAGLGASSVPMAPVEYPLGAKGLGKDLYPLGLSKNEVDKAHDIVIKHKGNYSIGSKSFMDNAETKDTFSSVDSLLVAQQAPGIVPEYFEARIIDHLPVVPISAPSYQFLQHNFASDTGAPGFVAEGTTKPQWNPAAEKVVVTAQKIAGYFNESSESMQDAPQWRSYLVNTIFRKIMQIENAAVLYGTVTSNLGIQGWSTQSGILTHVATSDPAGSTNLDSLELAINAMRINSGVYATPNICIMHPSTWSFTRRIKDTQGRYIVGDPLHEGVTSVWGVPVITTTAAAVGDAFLVDTSKMGSILVCNGIETHMGYQGTGLIENILTTVAEERIALATVIPSAVQYVTALGHA